MELFAITFITTIEILFAKNPIANQGQIVEKPEDIIREPYTLDFLQIPESYHVSESELESRIISKLQQSIIDYATPPAGNRICA